GLLLTNGTLVIAFGAHGDQDPYHGWVFAYDAATLTNKGVFCTTPNGAKGGVWQAGEGAGAGAAGKLYVGSGTGDVKDRGLAGGPDLGECYLKLGVDAAGQLTLLGWLNAFAPVSPLEDEDLGASSPLLLPGGRFVGGGKDGNFYLLDGGKMDLHGA